MRYVLLACLWWTPMLNAENRPDMVVADFEQADYHGWVPTGTAFGLKPATGTLPGQMHVSGYEGKQLVNSFLNGDGTVGELTSPPFVVERKYLNFLIGGGGHPGKTCMNLLLGDKIVRTQAGSNTAAGGSESLEWAAWDVSEFAGQRVVLQIVDHHTGGWGHVNVDQIVQSDRSRGAVPQQRTIEITQRYLQFPTTTGAPKRVVTVHRGDEVVRQFEIELAEQDPQFSTFLDVGRWQGETLVVRTKLTAESSALSLIQQSQAAVDADSLYREHLRPQFHFTSRRGWLNDPNGLVFFQGEYHLFYQHNPYGVQWGNMHWGHAVSTDLVHWQELPIALYQRSLNDMAFSGSAVVDERNTSGWGTNNEPPLVLAYTSTGRGECVAYSNDRGRTWTEYEGNPVVKHSGRDPRLLWYAPGQHWVMAVYTEAGQGAEERWIEFYTSPDLKTWKSESRISGYFECPDLIELPVQGEETSRWVLYGADAKYQTGSFDGKRFQPDGTKQQLWQGNFYAAQTFSNLPAGRCVQIGWANGVTFPGMPFGQQMSVPVELSLHRRGDGLALQAWPVKELTTLRGPRRALDDARLRAENSLADFTPTAGYEIEFSWKPSLKAESGFDVRGLPIRYRPQSGELVVGGQVTKVTLRDGRLDLRVLVDAGSVEVFVNHGLHAISLAYLSPEKAPALQVRLTADCQAAQGALYELKSAWGIAEALRK